MTIEEGTNASTGYTIAAFVLAVIFPPAGFLLALGLIRDGKHTEGWLAITLAVAVVVVGIIALGV